MLKNFDDYKRIIKSKLSDSRYIHSLNVAEAAEKLSLKYNADSNKAYLSGILHDITKEESLETQYEYILKSGETLTFLEMYNPAVIHQMSGAAYCELELGITDAEVLGAVRWHTTGKRGMTMLEKIVYTADFISAERNYPDVEKMRKLAYENIDSAILYSTEYTIKKLISNTELIHPSTVECYNSMLKKQIKLENK
ncbi:MAG: bis(5'-nucleosyl)-tetraphosphatase (symmetrical) YqeK [Clostridiales bacterium]|nr:bis(5'-nucleosyl)-tetraphosphatase (symmetrical) YqeK [Clostridiales bacterium]